MEQELVGLELQYWLAIRGGDAALLARLSSNPCVVTGAQGVGRLDRATLAAVAMACEPQANAVAGAQRVLRLGVRGTGRLLQKGLIRRLGRWVAPARRANAELPLELCRLRSSCYKGAMGRQAVIVLYVLAMVAMVVAVDVLFFRHRFTERLMANVGIVLVFGAFYLRFLRR